MNPSGAEIRTRTSRVQAGNQRHRLPANFYLQRS